MRRLTPAFANAVSSELLIVRAFRQERAVTIRAAKSLRDLQLHNSQILQRMVGAAILRRAGPDRYFLDERVWAGRRTLSTRSVWRVVTAAVLLTSVVAAFLAGR